MVSKRRVSKSRRRSSKRKVSKSRRRSSKRRVSKSRRRLSKRRVSRRKQHGGGTILTDLKKFKTEFYKIYETPITIRPRRKDDADSKAIYNIKQKEDKLKEVFLLYVEKIPKNTSKTKVWNQSIEEAIAMVKKIKIYYNKHKKQGITEPGSNELYEVSWLESGARSTLIDEFEAKTKVKSSSLFRGRGRILKAIEQA